MKFKFNEEIEALIKEIAELPEESSDHKDAQKLILDKLNSLPARVPHSKEWARLRLQTSFLLQISRSCYTLPLIPSKTQRKIFINSINSLNGKGLPDKSLISLGLKYGVVHLSALEIERLFKLNSSLA